MNNDAETRDKTILDAIEKLSISLNHRMDKLEENNKQIEKELNEIKTGQAVIKAELVGTRNELKAELEGTRNELKAEIEGTRNELKAEINQLDKRMSSL